MAEYVGDRFDLILCPISLITWLTSGLRCILKEIDAASTLFSAPVPGLFINNGIRMH